MLTKNILAYKGNWIRELEQMIKDSPTGSITCWACDYRRYKNVGEILRNLEPTEVTIKTNNIFNMYFDYIGMRYFKVYIGNKLIPLEDNYHVKLSLANTKEQSITIYNKLINNCIQDMNREIATLNDRKKESNALKVSI